MPNNNNNNNVLFAMKNATKLGEKVSKELNIPLSEIEFVQYQDSETMLKSKESVRSKDIYVITSTHYPVNQNIMELLIFLDSLRRASPKTINVVFAYYGYSRQDRKNIGREPITAKLIADLLEKVGIHKLIVIDLHNPSIQGFFNMPVDDLRGQYILAPTLKKIGRISIVSPDHGGAARARLLAELIANTIEIAIVDKRRVGPNRTEVLGILGNVSNKNVIIIDDLIDTGGTIIKAAKELKENGAKDVYVAATHGIFSKGFEAFENSDLIKKVFVTDSIERVHDIKSSKIEVITIAGILAKAIKATISSTSITDVYQEIKQSLG